MCWVYLRAWLRLLWMTEAVIMVLMEHTFTVYLSSVALTCKIVYVRGCVWLTVVDFGHNNYLCWKPFKDVMNYFNTLSTYSTFLTDCIFQTSVMYMWWKQFNSVNQCSCHITTQTLLKCMHVNPIEIAFVCFKSTLFWLMCLTTDIRHWDISIYKCCVV